MEWLAESTESFHKIVKSYAIDYAGLQLQLRLRR